MAGAASPSSLLMMSVQLLMGRSWLAGRAAKEGSSLLARMVTACMAQRWRESNWGVGATGEHGEASGDVERTDETVGWRAAIRDSYTRETASLRKVERERGGASQAV